jgi:flavin reductase (DIM6/NTAB) family NADH-FMN oxidoreductase RutF
MNNALPDLSPLQHAMKRAMRRLASSVAIVTTSSGRSSVAMVATSVSSLSLDPPSLVVCVNRGASIFTLLTHGAQFCVNLLAGAQMDIALHCGSSTGEARFAKGSWVRHVNGVPFLEGAQAALFCSVDGEFHYGTHGLIVGRISDISTARDVSSLVYVDGSYVAVCP